MTYMTTPQAGVPTTPIGPIARRWGPLIAFALSLLSLAIIGALASWRTAAHVEPSVIIIVATPTLSGPSVALAQPPRAILARFDYTRPETAAALTSADVVRIVGVAGEWRLVETTAGARVWIVASDLPAGTPQIEPLPDLAPPTAVPTAVVIYVPVPVERAVLSAPAPTVDHAACCEKPAGDRAERRRAFDATR